MRRLLVLMALELLLGASFGQAQTRANPPRVAVLEWDSAASAYRLEPFRQVLRDLGFIEGQTITIDYHFADGQSARADALAGRIAADRVAVIVALATPAAHAAKRATATIPIVFGTSDPIGTGLVSNLARPGGNLTGVSNMIADLDQKRVELLREILPGAMRVAFLGSTRDPATARFVTETRSAGERVGMSAEAVLVADPGEVEAAMDRIADARFDAVIVQPLFALNVDASRKVADAARRHRLPAISTFAHFAQAGGLLSYGPPADFSRRVAAHYVARILNGAAPGDLPVEQPTTFELVVNLRTAKALAITVPASLLARADEVIE